jgi:hypothetical protein
MLIFLVPQQLGCPLLLLPPGRLLLKGNLTDGLELNWT